MPTEVIIDDYIPVNKLGGQPVTVRCHGPELWVFLIEKAWAKLHGSYNKIETQLAKEALHDLTGAPVRSFWLDQNS